MPDLLHALQSGTTSLWLFIPTAILLGVLHGLEPGHSKTMMAAFIIAIRGTIGQAVLLGVSAAISHSLIIFLLAASALHFSGQLNAESAEPYLQIGSAVCILGLAAWMFLRTRRDLHEAHHHHHHHGHEHAKSLTFDSGHESIELSVFEDGVPPVFRLHAPAGGTVPSASSVTVETVRSDGVRQVFSFALKEDCLESREAIPEPHDFDLVLTLATGDRHHTARTQFREDHHEHEHGEGAEFQDAHELEHAGDIRRRFDGRSVTTPQLILFGVTGGLMPCPAAFSVLIICLQLKRIALGFTLVFSFSLGLAITMVTTGVIAAWSVQHAQRRFRGFGEAMRRAPYVSCVVLVVIAACMAWQGWSSLPTH